MKHDYLFKVALIGNSSVGKSSLLRRFADDSFQQSYLATIGVDFRFKTLDLENNSVKLQIWDTAGQERFRTITSAYYKGAQGIFIVYDVLNKQSFQDVDNFWLTEIEKYGEPNVEIYLLGNKLDCEPREITKQEVEEFCNRKGIKVFEVSAKTGENVTQAFESMTKACMAKHPKIEKEAASNAVIQSIKKKRQDFKLKSGQENIETKKKNCC